MSGGAEICAPGINSSPLMIVKFGCFPTMSEYITAANGVEKGIGRVFSLKGGGDCGRSEVRLVVTGGGRGPPD